jgi:hypothetical protein
MSLAVAQPLLVGEEEGEGEEGREGGGCRSGPRFSKTRSILRMGRRRTEGGVTLMLLPPAVAAPTAATRLVVLLLLLLLLLLRKRVLVLVAGRVEARAGEGGRRKEVKGERRRRK